MFAASLLALALVPSALAGVSITSPVASTSWTGGQQATISWIDDGKAPSLADFGIAKFSIYVGSVNQQTQLQLIADNVDVSKTGSIQFTPDPSIGANSNGYFIRVDSVNLKDATNPQFPAQAFSSKFTMGGMSGQFNATVQQQIDAGAGTGTGQTSAAPGASSAAPAAGTSSAASASKPASSGSASHTSSGSAKPSATGAANENGAAGIAASFGLVSGVAALIGAMVF